MGDARIEVACRKIGRTRDMGFHDEIREKADKRIIYGEWGRELWGENMHIEAIRAKVRDGKYIICFSHTEKMRLRKIEAEEIEEAICNGMIIESYHDDPRGASCLILGFTGQDRPLHVICGRLKADEILIITAYEPDAKEWEVDWKTRKKRG